MDNQPISTEPAYPNPQGHQPPIPNNSGSTPPIQPGSQPPVPNNNNEPIQPNAPKNNNWKKILMIIGGVAVGLAIIIIIIIVAVSANSKKYECTSSQGNITLMYDDNGINGYLANGISYNLDEQQVLAKQFGIEDYLSEFNRWFESNTDGTCVKK